jgi:hypothetical protein
MTNGEGQMVKKQRRSPRARKARTVVRTAQDVGLKLDGDAIAFRGKFPHRGVGLGALGDGGFRLTIDVGEDASEACKRLWDLIQTSFEIHMTPPVGQMIAFMASFPTRGGAINRNGDSGARMTLDVAEDEMTPMARLMTLVKGTEFDIRVGPRLGALPEKNGETARSEAEDPANA